MRRIYKTVGGLLCGILLSFSGYAFRYADTTLAKQQMLLRGIGSILERGHYAPKPIDDSLSSRVFSNYLAQLDVEKNLFLQSDLAALGPYRDKIDDEIKGSAPLSFYPSVISILKDRIDSARQIYRRLLAQPFDFNVDELFQPNRDSIDYPLDISAATEVWRKRLKYRTLVSYMDLLNQRKQAKDSDSLKMKTDAALQEMARNQVKSYYDRYFSTRFNPRVFDQTQQFSLYVNTITHEMDPHTDYFAPVDARDFNEGMSNTFFGIGALLGTKDGQVYVDEVMAGGAAWKSKKIAKDDVILKIGSPGKEPVDVAGYTVTEAVKLVRGAKGSTVQLVIRKAANGLIETVSLVREEVKLDQATAKSALIKNGDRTIGYINLPSFYVDFQNKSNPGCAEDIATELKKLKAAGMDGLILDLRNNPGGSLPDVNKIIGYFVPYGPAVQVRNRNGNGAALMDDNASKDSVLYNGPLTVMSSETSASASEIFIGAMKDYNRAIIVGSTATFGKGTVQRMLPLGRMDASGSPEFGSLKMTIEKFYRVNGGSNQQKGVASDIVIPDASEVTIRREKDEPTALPWDKITPADYKMVSRPYNKDSVVMYAYRRIAHNKHFRTIQASNEWLRTNWNAPVHLNLQKYRERQEYIKSLISGMSAEDSLATDLSVSVLPEDYDRFYKNPDAVKQKWYQEWLKSVSRDIYIQENVRIIADMLKAENAADMAKR